MRHDETARDGPRQTHVSDPSVDVSLTLLTAEQGAWTDLGCAPPQGISVLHELVDVALEILQKLSGHVSVIVVAELQWWTMTVAMHSFSALVRVMRFAHFAPHLRPYFILFPNLFWFCVIVSLLLNRLPYCRHRESCPAALLIAGLSA